jgi:hypothetical protein
MRLRGFLTTGIAQISNIILFYLFQISYFKFKIGLRMLRFSSRHRPILNLKSQILNLLKRGRRGQVLLAPKSPKKSVSRKKSKNLKKSKKMSSNTSCHWREGFAANVPLGTIYR